jgi:hypothetical protein
VSSVMRDCERITRGEGLAAGLAAALSGAGLDRAEATAAAPGPFAAVPAGWVPDGVPVRRTHLADLEGVVFVECPDERPPGGAAVAELARLLAAARLGLLRRLLDLAVEHLSGRVSGDEPLVRKQLVVGTIADVMAGIELIRAAADCQLAPDALGDLHGQLDELGWEVTKLFGAVGYIADHQARSLYVAALAAGTWVDREQVAP